jgi:hypothetical protein
MELAGKYTDLKKWSETPEATGGEYPTLKQELNRQLNILKTSIPGSKEAAQAMITISELQNTIAIVKQNTSAILKSENGLKNYL